MNIQQICVLNHLLRVLDIEDRLNGHLIPPEVMTTEQDYSELWQSECKCDCEWSNEKSRQQRRCRSKFAVRLNFQFFFSINIFLSLSRPVVLRVVFRLRSMKV